jgi:hypothetical protein
VRVWNEFNQLRIGYSKEPLDPIKGKEFLHQLSDYWLLKKDSVPWSLLVLASLI